MQSSLTQSRVLLRMALGTHPTILRIGWTLITLTDSLHFLADMRKYCTGFASQLPIQHSSFLKFKASPTSAPRKCSSAALEVDEILCLDRLTLVLLPHPLFPLPLRNV